MWWDYERPQTFQDGGFKDSESVCLYLWFQTRCGIILFRYRRHCNFIPFFIYEQRKQRKSNAVTTAVQLQGFENLFILLRSELNS